MAANGRGNMRPNGRSPPFLAIGLFITLVILCFNYWSLSKRNGQQANEIALFESELKLTNAQKTSAEKRSETISLKVKDLEDEITHFKQEIKGHKETIVGKTDIIENLQRDKSDLESQLTVANRDLDKIKTETLPTLQQAYDEKVKEFHQVEDRYYELQKEKSHCDESKCSVYIKSSRDKLLADVYKVAGTAPLMKLKNVGVDVGNFEDWLKDLTPTDPPQPQKLAPKAKNERNLQTNVVIPQNVTTIKENITYQPGSLKFTKANDVPANKNEAPEKQDDTSYVHKKSKQEISNMKLEDNEKNDNVDVETEKEKPVEAMNATSTINTTSAVNAKSSKAVTQSVSLRVIGEQTAVGNKTVTAKTNTSYTKKNNKNGKDENQVLSPNYHGDGDIDEGANEDDDMDDADVNDNKNQDKVLQDINRMNDEIDEMQENMDKDQLP